MLNATSSNPIWKLNYYWFSPGGTGMKTLKWKQNTCRYSVRFFFCFKHSADAASHQHSFGIVLLTPRQKKTKKLSNHACLVLALRNLFPKSRRRCLILSLPSSLSCKLCRVPRWSRLCRGLRRLLTMRRSRWKCFRQERGSQKTNQNNGLKRCAECWGWVGNAEPSDNSQCDASHIMP